MNNGELDTARIALDELFRKRLPPAFMAYPTAFSTKDHIGVRVASEAVVGDVAHHIDFWTVRQFFAATLGCGNRPHRKARLTGCLSALLEVTPPAPYFTMALAA